MPDEPYTYVSDILCEWEKDNLPEDIEEVKAVYDIFFSDEENEIEAPLDKSYRLSKMHDL